MTFQNLICSIVVCTVHFDAIPVNQLFQFFQNQFLEGPDTIRAKKISKLITKFQCSIILVCFVGILLQCGCIVSGDGGVDFDVLVSSSVC